MLDPSALEDVVLKTPPESKTTAAAVAAADAIPAQKKVVLKRKLIEPESIPASADAAAIGSDELNISATSVSSLSAADVSVASIGVTPTKVPKIPITAPAADDNIIVRAVKKVAITADTSAATAATDSDATVDKKIAEVAQLSYKERMELRAKRFGLPAVQAKPTSAAPVTAAVAAATKKPVAAATAAAAANVVSPLADPEQLKRRAERFGLNVADESAKLAARAERFGTDGTTKTGGAKTKNGDAKTATAVNPELLEQMRKRAERFGGSVSTQMLKIENEEKLRQRQERFNASAAAAAADSEMSTDAATTPAAVTDADPGTPVTAVNPVAVTVAE